MTKRILVVEDQEDLRGVLRDLLTGSGYEVAEAADGGEGVAKAKSERPDLILMDIQLPDMDGVTALGRLREMGTTTSIPVVALTAFAMAGDRERLLAAGFDGYLAKPIDIHNFSDSVRQYCEPT